MRSGHSEASQNLGVRIQYQSVYTIGISLWRTKLKFQSTNQQKVEEPGFIFNSYQNGMWLQQDCKISQVILYWKRGMPSWETWEPGWETLWAFSQWTFFIREVALLSDDAWSWRDRRRQDRGKSYNAQHFSQNKKSRCREIPSGCAWQFEFHPAPPCSWLPLCALRQL